MKAEDIRMVKPSMRRLLNTAMDLPTFDLKTRRITFDDRLQQVRVIQRVSLSQGNNGYMGRMEFIPYDSDTGFNLLKRYFGDNWVNRVR